MENATVNPVLTVLLYLLITKKVRYFFYTNNTIFHDFFVVLQFTFSQVLRAIISY